MDNNEIKGQVIERLPNAMLKIRYEDKEYLCYISGKMRLNKIQVLVGDWVLVKLDPYGGKTTNRIIKRY